jgi:hypothetical protein
MAGIDENEFPAGVQSFAQLYQFAGGSVGLKVAFNAGNAIATWSIPCHIRLSKYHKLWQQYCKYKSVLRA